jgi:two-component system, chemotaxis family, protein-glutamate methylesterase/glutaminase
VPPIRVLVVDDSVVIRRLVTDVLSADPDIEVVASAANGLIALARLEVTQVDVMTLDMEMPELDGLQTLVRMRAAKRDLPVIMFSTLTEKGAAATLDALAAGASDYVTKPSQMGSLGEARERIRAQLVPKIKALAGRGSGRLAPTAHLSAARQALKPSPRSRPLVTPKIVVIGCSTGGPAALATVLVQLPASFPVPILVVQHMPPVFTRQFAERLDRDCALNVAEAKAGSAIVAGTVLIAPGNFHLAVAGDRRATGAITTTLQQDPPENHCRPAVDVLFRSAAASYGAAVLAVVLTGMGTDGCLGAAEIRNVHGEVIVQDAATSVVWGMPGAIVDAGLADEVLPLGLIANALLARTARGTPRPPSVDVQRPAAATITTGPAR